MVRNKFLFIVILLITLSVFPVYSANLSIPDLEINTRGQIENGSLVLSTLGNINFLIEGGYKFGGRIGLDFSGSSLDNIDTDNFLRFRSLSIIIREIFSLPINFSYFVGQMDPYLSGSLFPELFGTEPITSRFRGLMYFGDGIQYDGIHSIAGSGIELSTTTLANHFYGSLSLYQDGYLNPGEFSADLRAAINFPVFKLEAFAGASYPQGNWGVYRGGLLLYYSTGIGGEFFTQIGIPRWDPYTDPFNMDLFYFMFEPRVRINILSIILTVFVHPSYYLQEATNEEGSIDVNVNFLFGAGPESTAEGGIEAGLSYLTDETEMLNIRVSPYFSFVGAGVFWDFKINSQLYPFSIGSLFEFFVGIRSGF
ncbi:MAG: hypothetical protein ACLFR1_01540 [Spirochaetia bacterium]